MKKWYHSKTLWANLIMAIAAIVQAATGNTWLDAEAQVAILAVVNVILRIMTKQGLTK